MLNYSQKKKKKISDKSSMTVTGAAVFPEEGQPPAVSNSPSQDPATFVRGFNGATTHSGPRLRVVQRTEEETRERQDLAEGTRSWPT